MHSSSSSGILFDIAVFESPDAEVDTVERVYRQEIERVIGELETLLLLHRSRVGIGTYAHAHDNLTVLKACYQDNALTLYALDVLLQHLLMLVQMLLAVSDVETRTDARNSQFLHAFL